jgi:integrase
VTRRSYGTGRLFIHRDSGGGESWYGRWYAGGRRIQRRIGPKRRPGSTDGLTRAQAERELRRRIERERPVTGTSTSVKQAANLYIEHLDQVLERKPSTLADYRSMLKRHVGPFFEGRRVDQVGAEEIERFLSSRKELGLATKTITNQLTFLHGVFSFAVKRGWAALNPVAAVDRPRQPTSDPDIRFLELDELERLLAAIPDDQLGRTDRALYLTAAMTGMRQGELIALRWLDVDWEASRIRVRRNFTRQRFGTPKSRRSSRSVPMTERVAAELRRHFEASAYRADEDLVFSHPETGNPLDASKVRTRLYTNLERAGLRRLRFHDLRHTFGTHCAAAGVPLRTLQEWLGHRDFQTTLIYADYAPSSYELAQVERAFAGQGNGEQNRGGAAGRRGNGSRSGLRELVYERP